MGVVKKRKILQIFSDGSLNFCYGSFFTPKATQLLFYEKDFKNFHFYSKSEHSQLKINDNENLLYRKKYLDYKTNSKNL
jgi:hypothetical protein